MEHLFISLLSLLTLVASENVKDLPSVQTKLGTIIGTVKDTSFFGRQTKVERYFGIPFAEPPVGDLRFRKPVPKRPFTAPFKAEKHADICFQMMAPIEFGPTTSEDCLYLNVYVPSERQGDLAVMVFIHGGGFLSGSANPFISDTLAAYGEVIVVTINYRLSVMGFLSTGDEYGPGNNGLWDQHLAIRWVHENINAFGGDSSRITIFGESAGAVSVVFQSVFEGNEGLFQRAISQSGSITSPLLGITDPKKDAEELGKLLGCKNMDSKALLDCLRDVPADVINATLNDFNNGFFRFPMPFVPIVDGEFIKEPAKDLLLSNTEKSKSGRAFFSTLDLLGGIDVEEGILMVGYLMGIPDLENFEPNRTYYEEELIPKALSFVVGEDVPEPIKKLFVHEYTDWSDPENMEKRRHRFTDIFTELFFSVTLLETVARHEDLAQGHKGTYMFVFDFESKHLLPIPSWCKRIAHGDELQYIFFEDSGEFVKFVPGNEDYLPENWERDMAKNIMTMWSNFAKTG